MGALAQELGHQGHDVFVVCGGRSGLPRVEKFESYTIVRSPCLRFLNDGSKSARRNNTVSILSIGLYSLWVITAGLVEVVRMRIHLVHGHTFQYGGIQSAVIARLTGIPDIVTVHGAGLKRATLYARLFKLIRRRRTRLVCQHELTLGDLVRVGFDRSSISLIEAMPKDLVFQVPHATDKKTTVVSFIGRLSSFRNPLLFIRAAIEVLKVEPDVRFMLAGDGDLASEANSSIKESGNSKKIIMLGRIDDTSQLLGMSDIYVACSSVENLTSLALLEAMAAGAAVVATDSGATSSIIVPSITGLLVPKDSVLKLADAVLTLVRDRVLRARLSGSAVNSARRFGKVVMIPKQIAIYRQMIEAQRTAS